VDSAGVSRWGVLPAHDPWFWVCYLLQLKGRQKKIGKKQCTYVLYSAWNWFRRAYDIVYHIFLNRVLEFPLSRNAQKRNNKKSAWEKN
jgi:hypothetical protein